MVLFSAMDGNEVSPATSPGVDVPSSFPWTMARSAQSVQSLEAFPATLKPDLGRRGVVEIDFQRHRARAQRRNALGRCTDDPISGVFGIAVNAHEQMCQPTPANPVEDVPIIVRKRMAVNKKG